MWFRSIAWATVLMVCLISLFQIKHTAGKMEREARTLDANIAKVKQSIEVLEAEWSHLNQPGYIAALASRHLGYDPDVRTRILNISDLPMRPDPVEVVPTPRLSAVPSFALPKTPVADIGLKPSLKPVGLQREFAQKSRQSEKRSATASDGLRPLTQDDPVGALIEMYGN